MNVTFQPSNSEIYTLAFYNTENLMGHSHGPLDIELHHLKRIDHRRYEERYLKKMSNIGTAISKIGDGINQKVPSLIGLAEVENEDVLKDLIQSKSLIDHNYDFVHFDSPDKRGMDVALLYNKNYFELVSSETVQLHVENEQGIRNYTRDILKVCGFLNGKKIHILVNHWPSRHMTSDKSGQQRVLAAQKVVELIENIRGKNQDANIVVMGDFNDNPRNNSVQHLENNADLYNPMKELQSYKRGSFNHNSKWMLFDQILLSRNFLGTTTNDFQFIKAEIFDAEFLKQTYGKSKNHPFMTFAGKRYLGGYSDHFPVYVQIKEITY